MPKIFNSTDNLIINSLRYKQKIKKEKFQLFFQLKKSIYAFQTEGFNKIKDKCRWEGLNLSVKLIEGTKF